MKWLTVIALSLTLPATAQLFRTSLAYQIRMDRRLDTVLDMSRKKLAQEFKTFSRLESPSVEQILPFVETYSEFGGKDQIRNALLKLVGTQAPDGFLPNELKVILLFDKYVKATGDSAILGTKVADKLVGLRLGKAMDQLIRRRSSGKRWSIVNSDSTVVKWQMLDSNLLFINALSVLGKFPYLSKARADEYDKLREPISLGFMYSFENHSLSAKLESEMDNNPALALELYPGMVIRARDWYEGYVRQQQSVGFSVTDLGHIVTNADRYDSFIVEYEPALYSYKLLSPMLARVIRDGGFYERYLSDGRPDKSAPGQGGSEAALFNAIKAVKDWGEKAVPQESSSFKGIDSNLAIRIARLKLDGVDTMILIRRDESDIVSCAPDLSDTSFEMYGRLLYRLGGRSFAEEITFGYSFTHSNEFVAYSDPVEFHSDSLFSLLTLKQDSMKDEWIYPYVWIVPVGDQYGYEPYDRIPSSEFRMETLLGGRIYIREFQGQAMRNDGRYPNANFPVNSHTTIYRLYKMAMSVVDASALHFPQDKVIHEQ